MRATVVVPGGVGLSGVRVPVFTRFRWKLESVFFQYDNAEATAAPVMLWLRDGAANTVWIARPVNGVPAVSSALLTAFPCAPDGQGDVYISFPIPEEAWIEPSWTLDVWTNGGALDALSSVVIQYSQPAKKPWFS